MSTKTNLFFWEVVKKRFDYLVFRWIRMFAFEALVITWQSKSFNICGNDFDAWKWNQLYIFTRLSNTISSINPELCSFKSILITVSHGASCKFPADDIRLKINFKTPFHMEIDSLSFFNFPIWFNNSHHVQPEKPF